MANNIQARDPQSLTPVGATASSLDLLIYPRYRQDNAGIIVQRCRTRHNVDSVTLVAMDHDRVVSGA